MMKKSNFDLLITIAKQVIQLAEQGMKATPPTHTQADVNAARAILNDHLAQQKIAPD